MAISSANFQKAKSNSVAETTREFEAKYLLPKEHRGENEFYNCGTDEKILFNQEVAKAERKGGRVPKLENSLWEGVINLNKKHTIEDVNRVGEHIAKKFNLHYTRGALHRDEGHINEKGKVEYNYHAHINFMTYKDGKQNWRLEFVNKEALRELQTEVAEILGMDRGEFNSKSVRANHRHFRVNAEEIKAERIAVKEVLATKEQLKTANNQLREFMKSNGAVRTDYAELERAKKELEEKLKAKELTEKELLEKFQELEKSFKITLERKDKYLDNLKEIGKDVATIVPIKELKEIPDAVKTVLEQNKSLEALKSDLEYKVTDLQEKIVSSSNMTAPQPPISVQKEFELIKKEELEEKNIKTGLFATEKAKVLKSETNFLQRTWNLVSSKYNDLKSKYDDLVKKFTVVSKEKDDLEVENKVLKAELEIYKSNSIKQQSQAHKKDHLKAIVEQFEVNQGNKSDSSILKESKELTSREKFELQKEAIRQQEKEKIKEVPELKEEEESSKKKKNYLSR